MVALADGGTCRWWHVQMVALADGGTCRWWHLQMVALADGGTCRHSASEAIKRAHYCRLQGTCNRRSASIETTIQLLVY